MANKERENFYRGTTLIVDNTKTSFVDLLELHLFRSNLSFQDFINKHQHQIYHLCYNTKKCCQCTPGYILPNNRILHYPQLEVLFDKYAKKPGHSKPVNRSDFCCAKTLIGITTALLDITLARTLLVNLCNDVFWYSCLIVQSLSLEDFLNQNKHTIYHLREPNVPCCQCQPGFIFPVTSPLLDLQSWKFLFNLPELPCQHHRMVPSDLVCTVSASRGIAVRHLSDYLTKLLIEQCCPLRKTIDMLIQMRNMIQGHASEGRISDADYGGYILDIESGIMEIAKVCKNEAAAKQSLSDLKTRSLDETVCVQYQNMLLEQIQKETQIEEKLDNIAGQLPEQIELALNKAFHNNMPDIVEQSVQLAVKKIYEPNSKLTIDQQRKKRKLLEDTFTLIQCHSSEETFVETHAMSIAISELEDKGMLLLTGTAGTGKSRNSLEILRRFSASHDKYCGIKLNNISEWFEIINENDCLIVLIDDIFGRSNCIFNAENEKVFDSMQSMILKRCVKVIMTMRNTIQTDPQVSDIIDRQRIFKQSRFIDLSSVEFKLNKEQKRECLLKYCEMNKIRISNTKQHLEDRQILDLSVPISLSRREIHEIADTDINPLMGYPESCYLFTSSREFTRQGAGFFKHPTKSLCIEIDGLRNGGNTDHGKALEYTILVYMALSEDVLDLHDINISKLNKVHELLYHTKEFTVKNILRGLGRLTKRYVKTNPDGTYSFQHRSIFEGVLLSYNDIETEPLIPLLHIDFILEIGRLEGYIAQPEIKNEVTILFDKDKYGILAQKIINELRKVEYVDYFIERLCSSRIIRNADENFICKLYNEYKLTKSSICCTLRHLDSEEESERFLSKICDGIYIPAKRTVITFLTLLLKYSMKYIDNDDTIRTILKLMQHDLQVEKNIYINESHEQCFTGAILLSCGYLNKPRLNMLWQFMKKNRIKFDKITLHSFNIGSFKKGTIAALQLLSSTVLASDLIESNDILTKAFEVNNTALIKLIFKQQDSSKIDVPLALYNACAHGAISIVHWFFKHFQQEQFDIEKALIVASKGRVDPPIKIHFYESSSRVTDTREVVVLLLTKFKTRIKNLDFAMHTALSQSNFSICKILMENTCNYFDGEAILEEIARNKLYYTSSQCFAFVKYVVSEYSCLNVDVLLAISNKLHKNFEMVKWIMSITESEVFYNACRNHHWVHKEICALKLIYDTDFYKTLDVTTVLVEELRYGNNDCIIFLLENIDVEQAKAEIVERVCSCGDEHLMQLMFKRFKNLDTVDIMSIAVKQQSLKAVKWLCTHFDKQLKFKTILKEATSCKAIPIFIYLSEVIDQKYLNTVDSFVALKIAMSVNKGDSGVRLFKKFFKDPMNEYRINDMLKFSCMNNNKKCAQVLFQNFKSEFLHFNMALKTVLASGDFDLLKIVLCKYETTLFDMNSLIRSIWESFEIRNADDITKWLLQNFDPILFDITYIVKMACYYDNLPFFQWLYRSYGLSNTSLESLFIHACRSSSISILQWLFERIRQPIDYKKCIDDAIFFSSSVVIFLIQNFEFDQSDIDRICTLYLRKKDERRRLELQLCIFETYGKDLIDVKSVFDTVCRLSSVKEVKWLMNRVDLNLLNFNSAIEEALRGNKDETFAYLYEFVNFSDPQEVDKIFIEACRYGNLQPVKFLYLTYCESLNISEAIAELCRSKTISHKHFDVLKFLVRFSSPSIIDCQLLMNRACKNGDIVNFCWLLENCDPDIFEVRSAIHHAFNTFLTEERKNISISITLMFLTQCNCVSSDIQAAMEIACKNEMPCLMNMLVTLFDWVSFDFQKLVGIALDPMKEESLKFILSMNRNVHIDIQNLVLSVCKKGKSSALEVLKVCISNFGLEHVDVQSTIHAILDIQCTEDLRNELIEILLQNIDNKQMNIMSVIQKIYTSNSNQRSSLSKCSDLVIWILLNCRHLMINKQETMLEMCRRGDFDSMKLLLCITFYRTLVNVSCMHNAFASGELKLITMLIAKCPEIKFDKKVALNNASTNGDITVVQWLFHTYATSSNRLSFLEPILDLRLARSTFDLNSAMLNACKNGNTDVVQWLLQIFPHEIFDMRLGLIETSGSGDVDLVKWMLAVYDNDIFDIETSLISACKNGKTKVVQFIIEKFGKYAFNIEIVVGEASGSGNIELVKWLHKTIDCRLYNIKSAMLMACINNRSDVVRWILDNFDHSYFNMQMATIVACEWGRIELV